MHWEAQEAFWGLGYAGGLKLATCPAKLKFFGVSSARRYRISSLAAPEVIRATLEN